MLRVELNFQKLKLSSSSNSTKKEEEGGRGGEGAKVGREEDRSKKKNLRGF